jgi:hypothetical protein
MRRAEGAFWSIAAATTPIGRTKSNVTGRDAGQDRASRSVVVVNREEETAAEEKQPMHDSPQVNSAIDAVRCLYLAKVAEREGHPEAAQRWRQLADDWLKHHAPDTERLEPEPHEAS